MPKRWISKPSHQRENRTPHDASVLSEAKANGAQLVVSACTISHANLDSYQVKAGKVTGKDTSVPVIHLAELVAFALGHFPDLLAQLRTRAMIIGG